MEVEIGKKIKELRERKGFTQEALGKLFDVGNRQIGRWERDEISLTINQIKELSRILEYDFLGHIAGVNLTEPNPHHDLTLKDVEKELLKLAAAVSKIRGSTPLTHFPGSGNDNTAQVVREIQKNKDNENRKGKFDKGDSEKA